MNCIQFHAMNQFCFIQAVNGLSQSVIVAVYRWTYRGVESFIWWGFTLL